MDLSLFGIVEKYNSYRREHLKDNNTNGMTIILTFIIILVVVILYVWSFIVILVFNLPLEIKILALVLWLITGPIIPLILAYVFKDKKL